LFVDTNKVDGPAIGKCPKTLVKSMEAFENMEGRKKAKWEGVTVKLPYSGS